MKIFSENISHSCTVNVHNLGTNQNFGTLVTSVAGTSRACLLESMVLASERGGRSFPAQVNGAGVVQVHHSSAQCICWWAHNVRCTIGGLWSILHRSLWCALRNTYRGYDFAFMACAPPIDIAVARRPSNQCTTKSLGLNSAKFCTGTRHAPVTCCGSCNTYKDLAWCPPQRQWSPIWQQHSRASICRK